jgi:hypothetical protein
LKPWKSAPPQYSPDSEYQHFARDPAAGHASHVRFGVLDAAMVVDPAQPALEIVAIRVERCKQRLAVAGPIRTQQHALAAQLLRQVE